MSDAFSFESDSVQRVRGASMAVVGLVTWGTWTAAYTLLATALGLPAVAGLAFFFGPALWFVAARRWLAPAPGHGSVEWSGEALTVLSGGLQLTVPRARVLGGAGFPEPHESVRLALAGGDELRIGVPDAVTGQRLLAALGCDERARPYAFVGDARARAVERAHRGLYAGFVAGGALAAAATAAGLPSLARAALALGTLAAMVVAYRLSLVAAVHVGADGLRVEGAAPRWIALSSIAGMRTAEGTLVLTLDDRTAAYLHGTAAGDDEATAAAVTRRLWALQQGERADPETAASLAPGAARADDGVYRRASTGREPLRVALRDARLPAALRLEAARRLAAEGPEGAALVRAESAAWVDAGGRRALAEIAPGREGTLGR
jgi:hypothetical protein